MPLVAAVAGYALGGGFELALACDIVIAADTASFGLPETMLGLVPGAGGTQRLVRAVGKTRAMEIILAGRRLSGEEAAAMGVASRVVGFEELEPEAMRVAGDVAARSTVALKLAKESVNRVFDTPLEVGLELGPRSRAEPDCSTSAAARGSPWCWRPQRGAVPSGLDISPGLLGIARERLLEADLREGDMEDAAVRGGRAVRRGDRRQRLSVRRRSQGAPCARRRGSCAPAVAVVASLFAAPERCGGNGRARGHEGS